MDKLLTFIVPAYNAEVYITKCLDSFVQSNKLDQIEIIVINDGSTDQTKQFAQHYVDKYPDSFRLINKTNGGHGSAINEGFAYSTGKYTKVVDSDDWILSENVGRVLDVLRTVTAQVVLLPYHIVNINTQKTELFSFSVTKFKTTYTLEELVNKWRMFEYCVSFHGIIYLTEFYLNYGIQLIEHVYYEDHEYSTIPFCKADSIYPIDIPLYQYRIGNAGQSVAKENQVKNLEHMEAVIEHMIEFYSTQANFSDAGKEFFYKKAESLILTYYKTACLLAKPRSDKRKRCAVENDIFFNVSPRWEQGLKRKYKIFQLLSILGITSEFYDAVINTQIYRRLRKKSTGKKR